MKKSVLILDDNPVNNRKYIDPLKEKFQVDVTLRMRSATRLLKTRHYDVVVIDIMMPSQHLSDNDEMIAGFNYYEEEVSKLGINSKILFWSRLTDSCFDKAKYSDEDKFHFVHKSESANHLLKSIEALFNV